MPTEERQSVISAINSLGRRVTAADIASKTGLPLNRATLALNKIAADTNGHLEVSTTGDIVYKFDPAFETSYLATGIAKVIEDAGRKIFELAFFLLRISFGIMLIVSFLLVCVLVIAIMIGLQASSDRDGGDGGGFDFNFNFFDYLLLRDLFWWGSWSTYGDSYYQSYDRPTIKQAQQDKGNFLFNVFSFLFGDGNPNNHLEERKWQAIAEVIHANKGVVVAEQIAPYTGEDPKNEDEMLPVLVRFEGRPEVTDQGNIVYVFPNLQARASMSAFKSGFVPACLQEFPWQFSSVTPEALVPVYILAGVNFLGSWWAMFTLPHIHKLTPLLVLLTPLLAPVTIYGTLFLLVPAIRYGVLQLLNGTIEKRNSKRQEYALVVQNKPPQLLAKLSDAAQFRLSDRYIGTEHLAYTTEKNADEQDIDPLAREFEAMSHNPHIKDLSRLRARETAGHDQPHSTNDGVAPSQAANTSHPAASQQPVWNPTNFAPDAESSPESYDQSLDSGDKINIKHEDEIERG